MKGQLTNEFILLLLVLILGAIGLFAYASEKKSEEQSIENSIILQNLCNQVADYINLATLTNGYNSTISLPQYINQNTYTISVENSSIIITVLNQTCVSPLTIVQIQNNTNSPPFTLVPGSTYTISSQNSVILIEK